MNFGGGTSSNVANDDCWPGSDVLRLVDDRKESPHATWQNRVPCRVGVAWFAPQRSPRMVR
jgi:hypothetical protein